jgi:hypothetical protein
MKIKLISEYYVLSDLTLEVRYILIIIYDKVESLQIHFSTCH